MTDFSIGHFDPNSEQWTQYYERFEQHLLVKGITAENLKRACLLTAISSQTYNLLRSLVAPEKPADVAFQRLQQILADHYSPRPSEIVERFRFNSRTRKHGESVSTFVSELRRLAQQCNYGTTLDTMLRDRVVCGIQDSAIQRRLLAEPSLTLEKCTDIALAMETAARNADDLQSSLVPTSSSVPNGTSDIHYVKTSQKRDPGQKYTNRPPVKPKFKQQVKSVAHNNTYMCLRCGRDDHTPQECSHVNTKCNSCGKIGHLSRVCITSGAAKPPLKKTPSRRGNIQGRVHTIQHSNGTVNTQQKDTCTHENGEHSEYEVFKMYAHNRAPPSITFVTEVNEVPLSMELDSGAAFSIITSDTYNQHRNRFPMLHPSFTRLVSYTGHTLEIMGQFSPSVKFQGKVLQLPLLVVKDGRANLCGRNWIAAFGMLY